MTGTGKIKFKPANKRHGLSKRPKDAEAVQPSSPTE